MTEQITVEVFVDGMGIAKVPEVAIAHYEEWITVWITALNIHMSPINAYEVGLRLTNDIEIQQLNTDFRQQARPTDVLSFAATEADLPGLEDILLIQPAYLGDIVISIDTAVRQAPAHNRSLRQELAWLVAHGLLHLIGWDHPDDDSLRRMLDKQTELLGLVSV